MGKLFDNPMFIVLILLVIVLLFGAPKLPGMARSLGQSMRIFKSEVKEMRNDDEQPAAPQQQHQIESATAQETRSAAQDADFWERPENQPR